MKAKKIQILNLKLNLNRNSSSYFETEMKYVNVA